MPKKGSSPRRDFPSYRGRFYVRENRGRAVVCAWPARRPSPRHPTSELWSEWLKQANVAFKALPEKFRGPIREAGKGWPQMPRDLAFASFRGTLWYYTTTDGFTRYPMQALTKVSESLDVFTHLQGALLVRGPELWTFVDPPTVDGRILTWDATTGLPEWRAAPTPGGNNYTPPLTTDFPTWINQLTATCSNAASGPLVLGRPTTAATPNLTARVRPLKATPATYHIAFRATQGASNDTECGLCIQDAATGRLVTYNLHKPLGAGQAKYGVSRWTTATAFSTRPVSNFDFASGARFFEFIDDGVNFTWKWSADDAEFQTVLTESRTAWLANPSHWGFYVANRAAEYAPSTLAVFNWHEA